MEIKPVAIVTGASQGIGQATALRLARDFLGLVLVASASQQRRARRCDDRTPAVVLRKVGAGAPTHRGRRNQEVPGGSANQPLWKAGGNRRSAGLSRVPSGEVDDGRFGSYGRRRDQGNLGRDLDQEFSFLRWGNE